MQDLINQVAAIAELRKKATPGPWEALVKGNSIQSQAIAGVCSGISLKTGNAAFIAAIGSLDFEAVAECLAEIEAVPENGPAYRVPTDPTERRAWVLQQARAHHKTFPGLAEGYTHDDVDKLFQWGDEADDFFFWLSCEQAASVPLADAALAELEELEQQATPAPWTAWLDHGKVFYGEAEENSSFSFSPANLTICECEQFDREDEHDITPGTAEDDASFIAAMRNALPGLLARLRAAEAGPLDEGERADFLEAQAAYQGALDSATETNRVLAERLDKAAKVLEGYQAFEGKVIASDDAWNTPTGHPWRTEGLYDEWISLQQQRNAVLRPTVKGGQPNA